MEDDCLIRYTKFITGLRTTQTSSGGKKVDFWCNELNLHKKDNRIAVKSDLHEKFSEVSHALKKCGFKDFLGEKEMMSKKHKNKPIHHHNVDKEKEI